jgi:hypothetical protein
VHTHTHSPQREPADRQRAGVSDSATGGDGAAAAAGELTLRPIHSAAAAVDRQPPSAVIRMRTVACDVPERQCDWRAIERGGGDKHERRSSAS